MSRPYTVGREKIAEFADALGDPNPAYRDPAAARSLGHRDVVAPPTFAVVVALGAEDEALAAAVPEASTAIHLAQHVRHHRPLVAGDVLCARTVITSDRRSKDRRILVTETVVDTVGGDPVCVLTSTLALHARG